MKFKSKKQLTEEFLEKIKTINIGGGKKLGELKCPGCGNLLQEHELIPVAIGGVMKIPRKPVKKLKTDNKEVSFAA